MVTVLIERHLHEGQLATYLEQGKLALQQTYIVPGFVSGEAFSDIHDENHRFLICKWKTIQDWKRWYKSAQRKEVLSAVHAILREPEKISELEN